MPTARVRLRDPPRGDAGPADCLPELLRTPSGTVMLEIQGVIHVGEQPLVRTELDLGPDGPARSEAVTIGSVDLSQVTEVGSPVTLRVGESQILRGQLAKLRTPLALMEMPAAPGADVEVVEVITHKVIFSARPEPVLTNKT